MEEKSNQSGSSDTFKANNSTPPVSSPGYFSSIFEPPSKITGLESSYFSLIEKKKDSGTQFSDKNTVVGNSQSQDKTSTSLYFLEETVQPFHYSSSLYYGGQDVYSRPRDGRNNPGPNTFKKEGKQDDPDSASRGNWWKGSLYY